MRTFEARLGSLLLCLGANACLHVPVPTPPKTAELLTIEVSPAGAVLARGTQLQLVATGLYSDDSVQDLSGSVTWQASVPDVATVSAVGVVSGLTEGEVEITATLGSVTRATGVRVTAAVLERLDVSPPTLTLARGTRGELKVMGTFSDQSTQELTDQVTWTSTDVAVATVANDGVVTAQAPGAAQVVARLGLHSSEASVTVTAARLVSLGLTPAAATLTKGLTRQFFATGVFTDATTQDLTEAATWTSSDRGVASVATATGQRGLVTALGVGSTSVSATVDGVGATATVLVTPATLVSLAAAPASLELPLGMTLALTVTGTYTDTSTQPMTRDVVWTSANPSIAEVSNAAGAEGLVTPLAIGTTSVTARAGQVTVVIAVVVTPASLVSIEVTPSGLSTPKGLTGQLAATGTYTDGSTQVLTTQVTWASSAPAIAAVSSAPGSEGQVEALAIGTVTLTASMGTRSGSTTFEVTPALLVSFTVSPMNPAVARGLTQQLTATGTYTDGTQQVVTAAATWTSSNPGVVAVSNAAGTEGLATALTVGVARVTATLGAFSDSTQLTVNPAELVAVFLSPSTARVALGRTVQLTASARYTDSDVRDVTGLAVWATDGFDIARVSNVIIPLGLVWAVGEGTAEISATTGGFSGRASITVTAAELESLAIAPSLLSVGEGDTAQLSARGTFSDGAVRDVTSLVTWTAQDPGIAAVSAGLVEGVSPGSTSVTAASGASSASATVTVTPQRLVSIEVTQTGPPTSNPAGLPIAFTALGTWDNGRTQDLTLLATWASSDLALATPRTAAGQEGSFATFASGQVTVTASRAGVTGAATIFIGAPAVVSFTVSPPTAAIAVGATQPFAAVAVLTDGSSRTITDECLWDSTAPAVATVTNLAFQPSLATGVSPGTALIRAECTDAVFATATLTVTP